ncbi:ABC transporter B family member 11-like [Planoprotostelium fungivorum]|uniref:ABC transporter B family member 11-like n=1 Tax=Planoprotostelium fungivorum TaxID=1890364 RepID=A0A2P6N5R7_9EUKA|nr:ABC transporter B family member 11-like [Planoprotostelium fungivorum]
MTNKRPTGSLIQQRMQVFGGSPPTHPNQPDDSPSVQPSAATSDSNIETLNSSSDSSNHENQTGASWSAVNSQVPRRSTLKIGRERTPSAPEQVSAQVHSGYTSTPSSVDDKKDENPYHNTNPYSLTPVTPAPETPSAPPMDAYGFCPLPNEQPKPSLMVSPPDTSALYSFSPDVKVKNEVADANLYAFDPLTTNVDHSSTAYSFDPLSNKINAPLVSTSYSYDPLSPASTAAPKQRTSFYQIDPIPGLYQLTEQDVTAEMYLDDPSSTTTSDDDSDDEFEREGMGLTNANNYDEGVPRGNDGGYDEPAAQQSSISNERPKDLMEIMFPQEVNAGVSQQNANGGRPADMQRDWNAEYQSILDMPDSKIKYRKLKSLATDFVYAAETYGRIIISEHCLPLSSRTIRPVTVGGLAGGEKFIVCGILFKFCVDFHGLYNGDHNAMKAASHELKGLQQYYYSGIPELRVPLMAYIDYRGWRLQAISLLPVGSNTLVYGSADGGRTMKTEIPELNSYMARAAQVMNIKAHRVGPDNSTHVLHSCTDIEGHKGKDGRFYLLDFARVAPCQPPSARGENLYNLFRFEFIRNYNRPISSDVFSNMGRHDSREHNEEAMNAQSFLLTTVIPDVCKEIKEEDDIEKILSLLHRNGINYRFLGHVRGHVTSEKTKEEILYECMSRVAKIHLGQILRAVSRKSGIPTNEPFEESITLFLNILLGKHSSSMDYWRLLKQTLSQKYQRILSHGEKLPEPSEMDRKKLITRILSACCIEMAPGSLDNINNSVFEFVQPDILNIKTHVAHLNLVEFADGMFLFHEAQERHDVDSQLRLLSLAQIKLTNSINTMIGNEMASLQMGNMFYLTGKILVNRSKDPQEAFENALQIFRRIQGDVRTDQGLVYTAIEMEAKVLKKRAPKQGNWEEVVEVCQRALKLNPDGRELHQLMAKILLDEYSHKRQEEDKTCLVLALKHLEISERLIRELSTPSPHQIAGVQKIKFKVELELLKLSRDEELAASLSSQFQSIALLDPPAAAKLAKSLQFSRHTRKFSYLIEPLLISRHSPQFRGMVLCPLVAELTSFDLTSIQSPDAPPSNLKDEDLLNLSLCAPNLSVVHLRKSQLEFQQSTIISMLSSRPLLDEVSLDRQVHTSTLAPLAKVTPSVTKWSLYDYPSLTGEDMEDFFEVMGSRVEELSVSDTEDLGTPSGALLSKHCTKLKKLSITRCGATDDLSNVLTESPVLRHLEVLSIMECNTLTSLFVPPIEQLTQLTMLDVSRCSGISDDQVLNVLQKLPSIRQYRLPSCVYEIIASEEIPIELLSPFGGTNTLTLNIKGSTTSKAQPVSPSGYEIMFNPSNLTQGTDWDYCRMRVSKAVGSMNMVNLEIRPQNANSTNRLYTNAMEMNNMFNCRSASVQFNEHDTYEVQMSATRTTAVTTGMMSIKKGGEEIAKCQLTTKKLYIRPGGKVIQVSTIYAALLLGIVFKKLLTSPDDIMVKKVYARIDENQPLLWNQIKDESKGKQVVDEKKKEEKKKSVGLFKLWRFATIGDVFLIILGSIASIGIGALGPIQNLVFGGLFNDATALQGNLMDALRPTILRIVYIGAATLVGGYIAQCCWVLSGERQTRRIRQLYVHSILRQDLAWFDQAEEGSMNTRLASDTQLVQDAISERAGDTLRSLASFIGGLAVAFSQGWRLALVILGCLPLIGIAGGLMIRFVMKFSSSRQDAYADAGAIAEQAIGGVRTVYAFSMQKRFQERYDNFVEIAKVASMKAGISIGFGFATFMFMLFSSFGLAFWYGAKLVIEGTDGMNGGKVLIIFTSMVLGSISLMQISPSLAAIATGRAAAYNIFKTIDRRPPIDTDQSGLTLNKCEGSIRFDDVSFSYPTRKNVPILQGVSIEIKPGMTVAFVGPSGSGKSTIVSLVQRFYDSDGGKVLLDGADVKSLDVKWLRKQIGVVGQEPSLFNMTIRDNLLLGAADGMDSVSERDMERACERANCHNFIKALPKGYDTVVGERGGMLSGGQKQRIAIARALIRNPKVLLLDEATSALDTASERLVQEALDEASKERTTIVVAHRLSTIRNADHIIVLKKGKVVEQGNHESLYNMGGIYKEMVDKQKIRMERDSVDSDQEEEQHETIRQADIPKITRQLTTSQGLRETQVMIDEETERLKKKEGREKIHYSPLWRVIKLMRRDWYFILIGCLGAAIAGTIFPFYGFLLSKVVLLLNGPKEDITPGPLEGSNLYSMLFAVVGVCGFVGIALQTIAFEIAGARVTSKLRSNTFRTIMKQEIAFYDHPDHSLGSLSSALAVDAASVNDMITKVWGDVFQLVSACAAGLTISFFHSWQMSLVIMAALPFIIGATAFESRVHQGFEDKTKKAYKESGQIAAEAFSEIRTVQSLTSEGYWEDRYVENIRGPHRLALRKAFLASIGYGAHMGFNMWTNALGFYAGIRFIEAGLVQFQDMFVVIICITLTAGSMGRASLFIPKFVKGRNCAINTFQLLDRTSDIDPEEDGRQNNITGDITMDKITFRYPSRMDMPIFNGKFNLNVEKNNTVALVGSSGCGKSTTIGLIERWYNPISGDVRADGFRVSEYQLHHLRGQMSLVGQEPVLFDMSVRENISYGLPDGDVSDEVNLSIDLEVSIDREKLLKEVCKIANVEEFITSLPEKYDTRVGEKGTQMSGGQKQRIAIARALVRKPRILLLDEATSALDSESEKLVQEALDRAVEGRTTITIAHRLSTVQGADLICVIKDGKVVEQGKHFELLEANGLYKDLVDQQNLNVLEH